jgi:hypothetical protein
MLQGVAVVDAAAVEWWRREGWDFGSDDEKTVVLGDDDVIVVEDIEDAAYGSDPLLPPTNPRWDGVVMDYVDGDVTVEMEVRQ